VSALETDRLAGKLRPPKSKETSRALALVSDKREDFAGVARQPASSAKATMNARR